MFEWDDGNLDHVAEQMKSLTTIHRIEEIPAFISEAEEHAFWATHQMSDELWERAEPLSPDELPPPRLSRHAEPHRVSGSLNERKFRTLLSGAARLSESLERLAAHGKTPYVQWNEFPVVTALKLQHLAAVEYPCALALLRDADLAPGSEFLLRPLLEVYAHVGWIVDDSNGGTQRGRAICFELGMVKAIRDGLCKMSDKALPVSRQEYESDLADREAVLSELHRSEGCKCKPRTEGNVGPTLKQIAVATGNLWLYELWNRSSMVAHQFVPDVIMRDKGNGITEIVAASFQQRAVMLDRLLGVFFSLGIAILAIANPSQSLLFTQEVQTFRRRITFQEAING